MVDSPKCFCPVGQVSVPRRGTTLRPELGNGRGRGGNVGVESGVGKAGTREPGAGGAHWQVPVVFGTSAQSFWVRLGRIANLPRLEARGVDGKLVGAWKMEGGRWCGSGRGVRQWFQRVGNRHRFRRRWSRYQLGPSTSTGALMWRWKGDEVVTDGSGVDEEVDIYIGEGEWMNAESKTGVDVGRWLGRWEPSGVLCESAKWMNA
ncbi:uncharacterized protein COLE_00319 [Cutaneotrichosporon oleaginosum]|uniref:uncharacterized protein n=1 Tax=Cutaneotrichosporon oleaginosum TaxID=879819 RepID=UPI00132536CD|nr:hypothetical protein COLE_00319 [Cutaneotrichosporon oleaginosum]